jgi:hypothetical protein
LLQHINQQNNARHEKNIITLNIYGQFTNQQQKGDDRNYYKWKTPTQKGACKQQKWKLYYKKKMFEQIKEDEEDLSKVSWNSEWNITSAGVKDEVQWT